MLTPGPAVRSAPVGAVSSDPRGRAKPHLLAMIVILHSPPPALRAGSRYNNHYGNLVCLVSRALCWQGVLTIDASWSGAVMCPA
jgi:hypothetical protein